MRQTAACWLVLAGTLGACARWPVQVRFQNNSAETLTRLDVDLLGTAYSFDSLRAGQLTRPVAVPETYYYAYARAITRTDTLTYRPLDYVGEKLYQQGKLTLELSIKTGPHRRTGQMVRYLDMDAASGRWLRSLKLWWFDL